MADSMPGPSVQAKALARFLIRSIRPIGDRITLQGGQLRFVREAFDATGITPLPRGTKVRAVSEPHGYGDVTGLWVCARDADESAGAILYLHGGGFVFGSLRTHRHLAACLSQTSGLPVLLLDYRRAPEHPFPAAADDALAAYRWLLDQGYPANRLVVAGDSAGGHLTAGLLADLTRQRMVMPGAAVLFSPFLDLTCADLDERDAACRDPYIPPDRAREAAAHYAGEFGVAHPRLAVLKGSKRRWPPMLIQAGDTECLLGDSERMAAAMRRAAAHCELQVWPGQVHAFPAFSALVPEGRLAIRYAGEFLRGALKEVLAA
ncbi:alpha/beta hydrolase [Actinokineospora iranica]|uniref:Acetyl esterase/lipase n=1 Tax=Actinokineospora iranica TaxID=1271860 RepID=A0A1G6Q797_9PSEU|nr:alpha/beta hydrolase [Actinokineospora iranica]SDC87586.1 Acetyl esterase/lipase [Actinokineospora iranica]